MLNRAASLGASGVLAVAALASTAAFAQTPTLRVNHAAARVVISAENRSDIAVSVSRGAARLRALNVRRDGGALVVDGGLDTRSLNCDGGYDMAHLFGKGGQARGVRRVKISGIGWVNVSDLPVITVHAPRGVSVSTDGAVWGDAGPSETLTLDAGGCGDWRIAAVRGKLNVHIAGSGDVQGDTAGALELSIAGSGDVALHGVSGPAKIAVMGSGDVRLGAVTGLLDAHMLGSGNLTVDRVAGAVKADLSGSSDVTISGGRSPQVAVEVAGSGDFVFDGVAGAVSASVSGSGDIHVAHAEGPVDKSVAGSGGVSIGR